jgi:light-regulated signal transduction histidine kinase (bacteriophytochrome)
MVRLTYAAPERESADVLHFQDGRVIERYVYPLRVNGAVEGHVCSFRDVTARVLADAEREHFNEVLAERVRRRTADLEASNMELESFSYSVSHDLRTPLRGIEGWSYLLLEQNGDALGEQGRTSVERVRKEAKRMATVLDDLLRLARVTRSEMRRVEVDLGELAREQLETLQRLDPERSVEVRVAPDLVAEGDRALLGALLANLLENAWKFTMRTPRPVIELGLETVDGERIFFVRDNGAGFDMAHADRLFGAFERLHPAREYPGTGIGLATVARVVRRHGGRVWAEGAVGEGATIRFTLG